MSQEISIILVNYNGKKYLEEFLDSVAVQDYTNLNVVLVDNASQDDSVVWLRMNHPEVHVEALDENLGFGEGTNIGIDYAIGHGAEYVLLLNTDTILEPNLVSELAKYADHQTVTTALTYCGARLAPQLWYAGGEIDFRTGNVNQLLYESEEKEPVYSVDFISGCCMLVHKDIVKQVGKFDRDFYLYYEDTDLCVRMKKNQIRLLYVTTTSLWHKVGGSSLGGDEMSCSTQYYVTRNRLLFADKHADLFRHGNLGVLREILSERAFFNGLVNAKYELYVKAAIADFLRGKFGKGYFGRMLLEDHYYVLDGFYEREEQEDYYWYCAGDYRSCICITNSKKKGIIYRVSFDIAKADSSIGEHLTIAVDGREIGHYQFPNHIEFMLYIEAEFSKRMNFHLNGSNIKTTTRSDGREAYYQLLNLSIREQDTAFYLGTSFSSQETDGISEWYWSSRQQGEIFIVNEEQSLVIYEVKFRIVPSQLEEKTKITILKDENEMRSIDPMAETCLRLAVPSKSSTKLSIVTEFPVYTTEARNLCFSIHNLSVEKLDETYYFGNGFYPLESDGMMKWCWSAQQQDDIYMINRENKVLVNEVRFSAVPFQIDETVQFTVLKDGNPISCIPAMKETTLLAEISPGSVMRLTIATNAPVCTADERKLCFRINNLSIQTKELGVCYGEAFYPQEGVDADHWCWSHESSADLSVVIGRESCAEISFMLYSDKKNEGETVEIKLNDFHVGFFNYDEQIRIPIKGNENSMIQKLTIIAEHVPYRITGDSRQFAFKICNCRLKMV